MASAADFLTAPILNLYSSLGFKPPAAQYTILASFFLSHVARNNNAKVIALSTGSKCLPAVRLPLRGDAVHDSHAEVLARRGAIRWFLKEIGRCNNNSGETFESPWIHERSDGKYDLKDDVQINLYISTVPCGDASTRFLASSQDEGMAALKDSTVYPTLTPNAASRGRDNYSLYGVLRTKPGRADSPPTLSMSCSDKIAAWNVLGIQGALASRFLRALYISNIVIGEVPADMQDTVREDCERALWKRLGDVRGLPHGFEVHKPKIQFTSLPFMHSRTALASTTVMRGSCNESLCWIADSPKPYEVLINGLKRGVSPKHRHREKSRPQLSRISLFQLYNQTLTNLGFPSEALDTTYFNTKQRLSEYQTVKQALAGEGAPFSGWVRSGAQWEKFNLNGECDADTPL